VAPTHPGTDMKVTPTTMRLSFVSNYVPGRCLIPDIKRFVVCFTGCDPGNHKKHYCIGKETDKNE